MRNYKAMKDQKLLRVADELEAGIGQVEDLDTVLALVSERGLERSGSPVAAVQTSGRMLSAAALAPMTCTSVTAVRDVGEPTDYLMNPKLDGYRLVCVVEEGRVSMMSRGEKWQDGKLPYLEDALLRRFPAGTVLDGEICALRDGGHGEPSIVNDFEHVQSIMNSNPERAVRVAGATRPLTYHCFDIMQLGPDDLRAEPLTERLARLNSWLDELQMQADDSLFQRTPYVEAAQETHDAWVHAGFEGTVLKRKDSTYHHGQRGHGWVKIKHKAEMDVVIVGFMPGQGRLKGKVGSTVFAQRTTDPEMLRKSAEYIRKLRKDAEKRGGEFYINEELVAELGLAVRGACSGYDDGERDALESSIGTVISVHHNGLMAGGLKVRHPQFFRRREDKVPAGIGWHHR
jgi:ATP-dependent DNA ligase